MFCKTKHDQGLIEVPAITPHLEVFTFDDAELGITADTPAEALREVNFAFYIDALGNGQGLTGRLTRDMLRLVDGVRTRNEIVAALTARGYDAMEINTKFANLAYRFALVSAEHHLPPARAALFSALGITPRRAEECLAELQIHIIDLSAHAQAAEAAAEAWRGLGGAAAVDDKSAADVTLVVVDDYLQHELANITRRFWDNRRQWLPLKLSGVESMAGPLFNLAGDSPHNDASPAAARFCFDCLRNNLHNNRELRGFLGGNRAGGEVATERVFDASMARGRAADALLQLIRARLFAGMERAPNPRDPRAEMPDFGRYLLSANLYTSGGEWHRVVQRPQCATCGDPQLRDNQRPPTRVELFGGDGDGDGDDDGANDGANDGDGDNGDGADNGARESVFTSGGMKARSPLQTWNRYAHLISPLTGVVTAVLRSSPADDSLLHVYWAGSNLAIVNRNFHSLSNSLRTKSAGKGRSETQARVSALCEALERYSGVYDGGEIHRRAKFTDFAPGEALRPNDIMLFSDAQYQSRAQVASKKHRFYRLPEMDFDENAEVEWTPFWSLSRERFVWVLSAQAYFSYLADDMKLNKFMGNPDSNGAASGNTLAEAFVQGFMELVERDAYAVWWYNRLQYPEVDIGSFNDPFLDQLVARYSTVYHRRVWALDITHDFGIPVFVAVSERVDKTKRDICVAAGAHFDPHIALLRAVCELNQYTSVVLFATDEPGSYSYYDAECLDWWHNATVQKHPYLLPDRTAAAITPADYPVTRRSQFEEAQDCLDAAHAKGLEVLVMDQTKPEVGLPVIKILAPGMRHFWARFAPGRLYDVPVAMGKLRAPTAEADLNPVPVFI